MKTSIDKLSERARVTKNGAPQSLLESLSWFIGSSLDQETINTLADDDRVQKAVVAREMVRLDELSSL